MCCAGGTLRAHYLAREDILVAVDLLVYSVGGIRRQETRVAPDMMVVQGMHAGLRGSYRVWEEGKPPDFVLEVLSTSDHLKEEGHKRREYARMVVREYLRYDPRGRTMAHRWGGRRLIGGRLTNEWPPGGGLPWDQQERRAAGTLAHALHLSIPVSRLEAPLSSGGSNDRSAGRKGPFGALRLRF